jgi:serine/threonine protein kinase
VDTDLQDQLQATLSSGYSLERELGGGGMSRVFLAEERALGRRVVVKVLSPDLAAGVSAERFKREIMITAQLQHPHIVPILSAGQTDGLPYYTMPFVEGESLRVRLMRVGAMPIAVAVSILRDVARALAFAHAKGIIHRDIKPDNILLTGDTAAVSDFGIGKALLASRVSPDDGAETLTEVG